MKELSIKAKAYVLSMVILGALSLGQGLWGYHFHDLDLLATLALLGGLTAKLKVRLPGVRGTVSMADTFVFAALMLLGPTEAMILAGLYGLIQCTAQTDGPPRWEQTTFSISAVIVSANLAAWWYQLITVTVRQGGIPAQMMALPVATLVYFIVNTLAVSGAIALASGAGILRTWHQNFLWTAACYFAGAAIAMLISLYLHYLGAITFLIALPPLVLVYYTYRLYLGRIDDGQRHVRQIEEMHMATIEALALAIEAKDRVALEHSQRVQAYAVGLAKALQLAEEQIKAVREAALLHDIGKLAVPEHILCKPGSLTPKEIEKVNVHPLVGYQILSMTNFQSPVAEIVLCHHERWDGTGYPNRLQGEQIPIGARILAVVDCFEALHAPRRYRRALPLPEVTAHILSERGKAFDPHIVDVFYPLVERLQEQGEAAVAAAREKRLRTGPHPASLPSAIPLFRDAPLSVYDTIGAANQEISALYDVAQVVGTTLRLNETLSMIALKVGQILPSSTIAIYLLENRELVPRFVEGVDEQIFRALRIPLGKGISGWVAENKQPILNAEADLEVAVAQDDRAVTFLQSSLAVPLIANDKVIGVLALYDLKPNRFEGDHLRIMDTISGKIAVALCNSITFEQTHTDALTDPITGLPNSRFLFMRLDQEISRARRNGTSLTVLAMDLDNFKQINDTMGHLIGDKVLIRVGQLLRAGLREYDFIARTGGDEFVALMMDVSAEDVERKIETIQSEFVKLKAEFHSDKLSPLGISIGYSTYGKDGQDTDRLLTAADAYMYRIKNDRKQTRALISSETS